MTFGPSHYELELFSKAHHWKRYFADIIETNIKGMVAEVGAGIGANARYLLNDRVEELLLIEPNAELFRILEKETTGLAVKLVNATLQDLESRFDTLIYIDVLEHIKNDHNETSIAFERLKENGYLIILSPAYPFLYTPFDRAVGHYRRYTLTSLNKCIDPRFTIIYTKYLDSVGMLASLGNKLFLRYSSPSKRQIAFWDNYMVPASRVLDSLLGYSLGKTVVGVYRK